MASLRSGTIRFRHSTSPWAHGYHPTRAHSPVPLVSESMVPPEISLPDRNEPRQYRESQETLGQEVRLCDTDFWIWYSWCFAYCLCRKRKCRHIFDNGWQGFKKGSKFSKELEVRVIDPVLWLIEVSQWKKQNQRIWPKYANLVLKYYTLNRFKFHFSKDLSFRAKGAA